MARKLSNVQKVRSVLKHIRSTGLDLPTFLYMLSYGDSACTADATIRTARTQLLHSNLLSTILQNWYSPPNRGRNRLIGARPALRSFAFDCVISTVDADFQKLKSFMSDDGVLSEEDLMQISFEELHDKCKTNARYLMYLLDHLAMTTDQQRNTFKTPHNVILIIICMLTYQRSQKSNRYQQWLSLYWVAGGIPSKAFDLLHVLGLAMSSTWVQAAMGVLSEVALQKARAWVANKPFAIMHDNLNIGYKVSSQRVDNHNHFDSGTALTILPLPSSPELCAVWGSWARQAELDNWRLASEKPSLSWSDLETLASNTYGSVKDWFVYHIIQFLVNYPDMSVLRENIPGWSHLGRPVAVDELPYGPDFRTCQYPLKTVHIDESTYEGTASVMNEIFRQLHLTDEAQQRCIGVASCIPWIGDQKTIMLLRHLRGMRSYDRNAFIRMDWSILFKGWFHELMALQNQIYWIHKGTPAMSGLDRDIKLLTRIGLSPKTRRQKADFHHLHETILHTLEAHIISRWLNICSVDSTEGFVKIAVNWSPAYIKDMAEKIYDVYISAEVLQPAERDKELVQKAKTRSSNKKNQKKVDGNEEKVHHINDDEKFLNAALYMRDALVYYELSVAIKEGDVGRMGNITPTILFMFAGGGNPHYTIELLEELQLERHVFTPQEVRIARHNCWLANTKGKRNSFFPLDQLQEHNIRMIKHIYAPKGPNASWEFLGKISPLIPLFQSMHFRVEKAFGIGYRGRRHAPVDKSKDVALLIKTYIQEDLHKRKSVRHDRTGININVIDKGIIALRAGETLDQWLQGREKYIHETENDWGVIEAAVAQTLPNQIDEDNENDENDDDNEDEGEGEIDEEGDGMEWLDYDMDVDVYNVNDNLDDSTCDHFWEDDSYIEL